jgi:hypothetical protein
MAVQKATSPCDHPDHQARSSVRKEGVKRKEEKRMQRPTHGPWPHYANDGSIRLISLAAPLGTHWQTSITASYDHIVQVFGQPTFSGYDDKTDVRWLIATPEGIASLYNYKNGRNFNGPSGTATEEITNWQIRADGHAAAKWLQQALTA